MKKAVISTGGKQYIISEGDFIETELVGSDASKIEFNALLIIDGSKVSIGKPVIKDSKVTAEIIESEVKSDKVTSIRYKSKKRVDIRRGHRQLKSKLKIKSIV
jgi:large subunit ribosomal protein L21